MSLLSLIAALLLEQFHPLFARRYLFHWMEAYVDYFERQFNAGQHRQGKVAWLLAIVLPLLLGVLLYWLTYAMSVLLAWLYCVLVLYLTLGFRQFSHHFTVIHRALREGKLEEARAQLAAWRGKSCSELSANEVARVTIEQALLATHRNVFGVAAWFVLFMLLGLGPVGAILYRLAQFLYLRWGLSPHEELREFGAYARQAYRVVEWLPLRLTAITFAIIGDFEDTVYCWRTQADNWPDPEAGIVLASGAGALGVRLGQTVVQDHEPEYRPEIGTGDEVEVEHMQSAVGLVWRALVFWLILLLLLTLASLLG